MGCTFWIIRYAHTVSFSFPRLHSQTIHSETDMKFKYLLHAQVMLTWILRHKSPSLFWNMPNFLLKSKNILRSLFSCCAAHMLFSFKGPGLEFCTRILGVCPIQVMATLQGCQQPYLEMQGQSVCIYMLSRCPYHRSMAPSLYITWNKMITADLH